MRTLLINITQSLEAIRDNFLRVSVTIFIIALGITALVGVQVSIDGIQYAMVQSFSALGANTFNIEQLGSSGRARGRGMQRVVSDPVSYQEAREFKEAFGDIAPVSISAGGNFAARLRYQQRETNPNISILGVDGDYLAISRYSIREGRNLTEDDVSMSAKTAVVGQEIVDKLFPSESPLNKKVSIDGSFYTIVGVYDKIGGMSGSGGDKIVTIPISSLRSDFPSNGRSFNLSVYCEDTRQLDFMMLEAEGIMRMIRGLRPDQENTFEVMKSDAFAKELMDNISVLTISATVIAIITLLGAAIALLNVMLVSVTERTNEIGVRKALGASRRGVMTQFLTEAIVICQLGGLLGVVLGLLMGNIIGSVIMGSGFVAPWLWIGIGLLACLLVGVASGAYPAWKAARVDPIESLRYE